MKSILYHRPSVLQATVPCAFSEKNWKRTSTRSQKNHPITVTIFLEFVEFSHMSPIFVRYRNWDRAIFSLIWNWVCCCWPGPVQNRFFNSTVPTRKEKKRSKEFMVHGVDFKLYSTSVVSSSGNWLFVLTTSYLGTLRWSLTAYLVSFEKIQP